jgi:hypothetical protein
MIFYTYDEDGDLVEVEGDPVFTSMDMSPQLTEAPPNIVGVAVAIPAKDGKPRLAYLPYPIFAKTEDLAEAQADLEVKPDWFNLGQVTLGEKTEVARGNGVSTLEVVCQLAEVGDTLVLTSIGKLPVGYLIGNPVCAVAGNIQVPVFHPAQDAQAEFSFLCKVVAFRNKLPSAE